MSKPENSSTNNKLNQHQPQKFPEKILKAKFEASQPGSKNKKAVDASPPQSEKLNGYSYIREKDLPPLLALWPHEIEDQSISGAERVIAKLSAAIRAERNRGKSGHWSYDLNRHIALSAALKEEQRRRLTFK